MENQEVNNITELLEAEIKKLKNAVSYIEEAKYVSSESVRLLSEMNNKYEIFLKSMQENKIDINSYKTEIGILISNSTKSFQNKVESNNTEFKSSLIKTQAEFQIQIQSLMNLNKRLKYISLISLLIALLSLLLCILN